MPNGPDPGSQQKKRQNPSDVVPHSQQVVHVRKGHYSGAVELGVEVAVGEGG